MSTIESLKNELRKIEKDVLKRSNECDIRYLSYPEIWVISVEENIVLWEKKRYPNARNVYFYTDMEGNLLFNGKFYVYATPFSNSRAFVNDGYKWFIIDLNRKEKVSIPDELVFDNINGFRNDNLALFNRGKYHWGSVLYNPEDNSFEEKIPYIWDALEFSRLNGQVCVGIHYVSPIFYSDPDTRWNEDHGDRFVIPTIRIPIDKANDLKYYNRLKEWNEYSYSQNVIRFIEERRKLGPEKTREERKKLVKDYLKTAYNISDFYFDESYREEFNSNDGTLVDVGDLKDYQVKKGKIKLLK